ncbi:Lsr2 dimerization domain-containing protein [Actinomadura luteofluorescens]
MAEKVIRVDDMDGSEGADVAKRDFEVLDRTFTIDLNDDNYKRLNEMLDALAPFIENAAEVKRPGRAASPAPRRSRATRTAMSGRGHCVRTSKSPNVARYRMRSMLHSSRHIRTPSRTHS